VNYPRLVIAGVHSGVGKTTLSLGLLRALYNRGCLVQPFKVGPDYIDPGLHAQACGVKSHNLDNWMGTAEVVKAVFVKNAVRDDIAIIEGVMGLYDGANTSRLAGSTAELALLLKAPVVLVVNVQGMAQSAAALIKGYMDYEPKLNLAAVVLNNASEYHQTVLKKQLEEELGIKVLGCLPRQSDIRMPSRHLGLLPAEENSELQLAIAGMAQLVEKYVDVEAVVQLAQAAGTLPASPPLSSRPANNSRTSSLSIRIGVAQDSAFTFYYQDSLDYLEELGVQIVSFSPLHDTGLPEVDGLYLGGGFPEMFLAQLAENHTMLSAIKTARQENMPIYAECGGFLYLSETIRDFAGKVWPGAGIIPAQTCLGQNLAGLGYIEARLEQDSILGNKGALLRGHEFHYSTVSGLDENNSAYQLQGGKGPDGRVDGYVEGNLLASYVHLHLRSNPAAADNFMKACMKFKELKQPGQPANFVGGTVV